MFITSLIAPLLLFAQFGFAYLDSLKPVTNKNVCPPKQHTLIAFLHESSYVTSNKQLWKKPCYENRQLHALIANVYIEFCSGLQQRACAVCGHIG